jgi:hypothetical protein
VEQVVGQLAAELGLDAALSFLWAFFHCVHSIFLCLGWRSNVPLQRFDVTGSRGINESSGLVGIGVERDKVRRRRFPDMWRQRGQVRGTPTRLCSDSDRNRSVEESSTPTG